MVSSGMLRRVALVRTDDSKEVSASTIRNNVVPSSRILVTLIMEELQSSKPSVLTRATRSNMTEDGILHSHHSENHKSYMFLIKNVFWEVTPCGSCKKRRFRGT
jgi:hypothetical protein